MKPQKSKYRKRLGELGEDLASDLLLSKGFRIIERNYKARYGEIDIIALDRGTLVFVEVKTRIRFKYGRPEEAITKRKLAEVSRTGLFYSLTHPGLPELLRIDVIAISLHEDKTIEYIKHFINASLS